MKICDNDKCTGCFACISSCPVKCISMQENEYGESHPIVNEDKCIHCNSCVKSCPNNTELDFHYPIHCYASWITNIDKRRICASGGIGTIMSEYVINHKHGMVYGTQYDENMEPHTVGGNTATDIEKFKGSKYVQSIVGDAYVKIRKDLEKDIFVLYIGTPCQIAGLKTYLKHDYEKLVTVDLICHGVCPTSYFNQEISFLKQKKRIKCLTDVRFRGNDNSNFCLSLWDKKKLIFERSSYCDFYLGGFLWGVTLRENCYTCNYARPQRISDITIGDFIGLGQKTPFLHSVKNVSSVFINTSKGEVFYDEVSKIMSELINVERDYNERLEYTPSLKEPFKRDTLNEEFRAKYVAFGFPVAIRKTLGIRVYKARSEYYWNKYIKRYFYNAPKKIVKSINSIIKNISR